MKANVFVFLREYNDVDHITPVIDHLCLRQNVNVKVFCINENDNFFLNANLLYLKDKYNLEIIDFLSVCRDSKYFSVIDTIIERISRRGGRISSNILVKVLTINASRLLYNFKLPIFNKILLSNINPDVCIFDVGTEYIYPQRIIHKLFRNKKIPRICIHHGLITHLNPDFNIKQKILLSKPDNVRELIIKFIQNIYSYLISLPPILSDGYIVPGKHYELMRTIESGKAPRDVVYEVASLRYTHQWNYIYEKNIYSKSQINKKSDKKLKVVLMMISERYNVNREAIIKTIESVSILPWVDLVIKPFTRGDKVEDYIQKLSEKMAIDLAPERSSLELINNTDVTLAYGTSIEFQALLSNKALVHMTYIDSNYTIFEKYKVSWAVESIEQLTSTLLSLYNDKTRTPYTDNDVDLLFDDIIYGGYERSDIFNTYRNIIEKISNVNL